MNIFTVGKRYKIRNIYSGKVHTVIFRGDSPVNKNKYILEYLVPPKYLNVSVSKDSFGENGKFKILEK